MLWGGTPAGFQEGGTGREEVLFSGMGNELRERLRSVAWEDLRVRETPARCRSPACSG